MSLEERLQHPLSSEKEALEQLARTNELTPIAKQKLDTLSQTERLLINRFEEDAQKSPNTNLKKIKPVRIRIKSTGRWLTTFSRKTIWKRKNHAVSALNLHLKMLFNSMFRYNYTRDASKQVAPFQCGDYYFSYSDKDAIINDAVNYVRENLVEFVEVDS